jgi:hypothetical protein
MQYLREWAYRVFFLGRRTRKCLESGEKVSSQGGYGKVNRFSRLVLQVGLVDLI